MTCVKCNRYLVNCICPDLEERLGRLRKSPHIHVPSLVDKPLLERKLKREQPNKEDQ